MSNEILIFNIYGQYLKRRDHHTIVNKSHNILKCKFTFKHNLWDGVEKFALFSNSTDTYNIPLGNKNSGDCIVPWEVLQGKWFKITLYGGDLITTNEVTIPLIRSGYTTDITPTSEASRDAFIVALEQINSKIDYIEYDNNQLLLYSNGELLNSISLPFLDEEQILEYLEGYLSRDDLDEVLEGYVKLEDVSFVDGVIILKN